MRIRHKLKGRTPIEYGIRP
ncbi:hypothetical protein [uncultured Lactobacillus sp.]